MSEVRIVFTIEEDPIVQADDDRFIVRQWELNSQTRDSLDLGEFARAKTFEAARALVPPGMAPLPVSEPVGVKFLETWI